MKTITPAKPLRIRIRLNPVSHAVVKVGEIAPCCGSVRVQGWVEAPNKPAGFEADFRLALHLGIKSVGGVCLAQTNTEAVCFPFSFDMQPDYVRPSYRKETMEEAVARVAGLMRKAQRHFAKLQREA